MKKYNVYIYDSESGCNQPVLVECKSKLKQGLWVINILDYGG